jgi:L-ascorbate metabolism protein UlaG (beta-lactamase superfamily)
LRVHPILKKLYSFKPDPGQLGLVWLGQNGFLLKTASAVIAVDPYLSDFAEQWTYGWKNEHIRMSAVPIQPKELFGIDLVLCTHDHVDHIDPFTIPILALRNPETRFITPKIARTRMLGLFVNERNLYLMKGKDTLTLNGITVHAIPASHSKLTRDRVNGYHFLSYIIEADGLTIFHAGDTIPYRTQINYLKKFKIDLAFLPINGRKPAKFELEPNFTIDEAIDLAVNLQAKMVIPMHYDTYTLNTANIADFVIGAESRINYRVAQIGLPFMFKSFL